MTLDTNHVYIDSTKLRSWLTCRKHYELRHLRHLAPIVVSAPLSFGKAWHTIAEMLAKGKTTEEAITNYKTIYTNETKDELRTVNKGVELINLYTKKYKIEPFKYLHTETPFAMPLQDDIVLCGKEDAIVEWNGEIYVFERKTTSRLGITFFKKFRQDYQIDIYCLACRELVGSCAGAIIDAVRVCKPKAKMEVDLVRDIVGRTDRDLDTAKEEIIEIVKDIRNGKIYKNKMSCYTWGGGEFLPICESHENPKVIRDFYKESRWNPTKGVEEQVKKIPEQQLLKL